MITSQYPLLPTLLNSLCCASIAVQRVVFLDLEEDEEAEEEEEEEAEVEVGVEEEQVGGGDWPEGGEGAEVKADDSMEG